MTATAITSTSATSTPASTATPSTSATATAARPRLPVLPETSGAYDTRGVLTELQALGARWVVDPTPHHLASPVDAMADTASRAAASADRVRFHPDPRRLGSLVDDRTSSVASDGG